MREETVIELLRLVRRTADEAITIVEGNTEMNQPTAAAHGTNGSVAAGWREVERQTGESWTWPDGNVDTYSEIVVYEGSGGASDGVKLGLGYQDGPGKDGEVNGFVFASGGASKRPLTVFFPTDDFDTSQEVVSMVRGRDGGRKTFRPTDVLPAAYGDFKTDILGQRIKGKWNVQAVVAKKEDVQTMLNHTAIQARLRGLI